MALIRLSRLDDLISLSQLSQMLQGGEVAAPQRPAITGVGRSSNPPVELSQAAKKKPPAVTDGPANTPLTAETLPHIWPEVLTQVDLFSAGSSIGPAFQQFPGQTGWCYDFPWRIIGSASSARTRPDSIAC